MAGNTTSRKRGSGQAGKVPRPKKLRRSMAERPSLRPKTIIVLIGETLKAFIVDKHVLLTSSDLFEKTIGRLPKSDVPKEVKLPETTPRAFEIYLGWLRTGCFFIMEDNDTDDPPKEDSSGIINDCEWDKWNECYRLGHYLQDCSFKDACIDLALDKMISEKFYMIDLAATIYKASPAPSAHRKFAIDVIAHLWNENSFQCVSGEDNPPEFLVDLIRYIGPKMRRNELGEYKDTRKFFKGVGCKYHAHIDLNKPCYKETHRAYK